jgi:hypothetical protein
MFELVQWVDGSILIRNQFFGGGWKAIHNAKSVKGKEKSVTSRHENTKAQSLAAAEGRGGAAAGF